MKIRSYIGVGMRCSHCGSLQEKNMDVFDGMGKDEKRVLCSVCGERILEIVREKKSFRFEASCPACGDRHKFAVPVSEALHTSAKKLMCPVTRVTALVVGRDKYIDNYMKDDIEVEEKSSPYNKNSEVAAIFETVSRAGGAFRDPRELFICLEHFKNLSAEGRVGCECGESVMQLQVEEDGFRVLCSTCGRDMFFDFTDRDGIEKIKNISEIFLT